MEGSLTVNKQAEFQILAITEAGKRRKEGGDSFFVAIRGASRVRARILDTKDGTYTVLWKPIVSGDYSIAVSLFGVSLPGSPYPAHVFDPAPFAPMCSASGSALKFITARTTHTFAMRFCDRSGNVAQAVDLDVFVDPLPLDPESAAIFDEMWAAAAARYPTRSDSPQPSPPEEELLDTDPASAESPTPKPTVTIAEPDATGTKIGRPVSFHVPTTYDAGSADEASAGEDVGESVSHEDSAQTKKRAIRIQVGRRALVVRAEEALDSPQIGQLQPGQTVLVIEERIAENMVRARVTFQEIQPADEDGGSGGINQTSLLSMDQGGVLSPNPSPERPSSPTPSIASATGGQGRVLTGWVTLKKNGKNLVSSRLKLEMTARQQYMQQFSRRQLNDKHNHGVSSEIDPTVDPNGNGVAFAFGGVYPGYLHAKGKLVEKHSISFSVGRVGRYLLHVRLRQQAAGVPGSPFALVVGPGKAEGSTTCLAPAKPLCGSVGEGPDDGCTLTVFTNDVMSNPCTEGGAEMSTECVKGKITGECEDNKDGSYTLKWRGTATGTFLVKVNIGEVPLKGSPMSIKLISTIPEIEKCVVSGDGLKSAVAGQPATVCIRFIDSYGNNATPEPMLQVGLAISNDKKKLAEVKPFPFNLEWQQEGSGECKLTFFATHSGANELHTWILPQSKGERLALPGSPFTLHVAAGTPTASHSHVTGWHKGAGAAPDKGSLLKSKADMSGNGADIVIAGDQICVKPNIADQFDNMATLSSGMLVSTLLKPDGTKTELNLLTTITKSTQLSQYEVKAETSAAGKYEMNLMLDGNPIQGSPVIFNVHEAGPDPRFTKLVAPANQDTFVPDLDVPATILLATFDKYGNACTTGGLAPTVRISIVKQEKSAEQAILMANNHSEVVEDLHNGSYAVKVAVKMACSVKLIVNMDKNIPGQGGELPAMILTFAEAEAGETMEAEYDMSQGQSAQRQAARSVTPSSSNGGMEDAKQPSMAGTMPKKHSGGFVAFLQSGVDALESATGIDIDGDGKVGAADAQKDAPQQHASAPDPAAEQSGGFGSFMQSGVDALESATGIDIDGDGKISATDAQKDVVSSPEPVVVDADVADRAAAPAPVPAAKKSGGFDSFMQSGMNAFEAATGIDIDGDGKVGAAASVGVTT